MPHSADFWPTTFSRADRRRFTSLVRDSCARLDLRVTGDLPDLLLDDGGQVSVRNLVETCAVLGRQDWPAEVRRFFDVLLGSRDLLPQLKSVSRDVVDASLRIRLAPAGSLPGFAMARPALPGLDALLYLARPGFGHGVNDEMVELWGLDLDDAFELARANTMADMEIDVLQAQSDDRTFAFDGPSIYASAYVLNLADSGLGPLVVGVPTRHMVVLAPLDADGHAVATVCLETFRAYRRGPGPTSTQLWFVDPDTLGHWGEGAEPITIELLDGRGTRPRQGATDGDIHVAFGPRLHAAIEALGDAA